MLLTSLNLRNPPGTVDLFNELSETVKVVDPVTELDIPEAVDQWIIIRPKTVRVDDGNTIIFEERYTGIIQPINPYIKIGHHIVRNIDGAEAFQQILEIIGNPKPVLGVQKLELRFHDGNKNL